MTTPVSDRQVVLAKFAGAMIFYLLTWTPLLACLFVVRHFGNDPGALDPGTLASTFLGITLLGGLYMSLGCFASSLTRSQIIAAMTSFVLGLGLFLLSLRSLVPTPPTDWAGQVFAYISMSDHLGDFARGIIDTRQVVFYLSLTAFFLLQSHGCKASSRRGFHNVSQGLIQLSLDRLVFKGDTG